MNISRTVHYLREMMEFLAEGKKAKKAKSGGKTKGKKVKMGGETEYAYLLKREPKAKNYGVHKGDYVVWRRDDKRGVYPIKAS